MSLNHTIAMTVATQCLLILIPVLMRAAATGQVFKALVQTVFLLSHLIFTIILKVRHCYLSFLDEEMEV